MIPAAVWDLPRRCLLRAVRNLPRRHPLLRHGSPPRCLKPRKIRNAAVAVFIKVQHLAFVDISGVNRRFRHAPQNGNRPKQQINHTINPMRRVGGISARQIKIAAAREHVKQPRRQRTCRLLPAAGRAVNRYPALFQSRKFLFFLKSKRSAAAQTYPRSRQSKNNSVHIQRPYSFSP